MKLARCGVLEGSISVDRLLGGNYDSPPPPGPDKPTDMSIFKYYHGPTPQNIPIHVYTSTVILVQIVLVYALLCCTILTYEAWLCRIKS